MAKSGMNFVSALFVAGIMELVDNKYLRYCSPVDYRGNHRRMKFGKKTWKKGVV